MKTKIIRNLAVWILIGVLALSGCGAPPEAENIPEESAGWDIVTYAPKEMESRQYHWVILQNGRNVIDQTGTDRINERLKELKVDAALCFHVVTMQEYVPPPDTGRCVSAVGRTDGFCVHWSRTVWFLDGRMVTVLS